MYNVEQNGKQRTSKMRKSGSRLRVFSMGTENCTAESGGSEVGYPPSHKENLTTGGTKYRNTTGNI